MLTTVPYGTQGVVVPSIGISRCWFDDDLETLVYFYGPIAILFICNIGLIASTAWNYKKIEKIALGIQMKSKTETEKKVLPPVEYERQKQTTKNFEEFKTKFSLMTLMCICWIAEILSWKIPPIEIWAFTDVLNSLQGFFIFVIFLSYRKNRKTLKRLHPKLYAFIQPFINILRKIRNFLLPKKSTPSSGEAAGRSREPSISSEYSDLSDNYKPPEPVAA
ncbi:hypothetical protein SK128_015383 [Halocaridina rubra]|uniref:Uncharacterized protein n=1 Tax=Halocaridina rubra TaxID=373956 RepID=A0AAN8ZT23_HALRR